MKLVYYTYRKISLLLFVLMTVWGVLFYYAIIDEVVDETDDTLENYAGILMEHALHDPSVLETEGSLMSFYKFLPISEEEGRQLLAEIHAGLGGHHAAARALVSKAFRTGFFWPTTRADGTTSSSIV